MKKNAQASHPARYQSLICMTLHGGSVSTDERRGGRVVQDAGRLCSSKVRGRGALCCVETLAFVECEQGVSGASPCFETGLDEEETGGRGEE